MTAGVFALLWSVASGLASGLASAVGFMDGLPDSMIVFPIPGFWWALPSGQVIALSWSLTGVAVVGGGWAIARRRARSSDAVALIARTSATIPIGILLPAAVWQAGMSATPAADDLAPTPAFLHVSIALVVVALPLAITVVRPIVQRRTFGLSLAEGQQRVEIAPDGVSRMLATFSARLDPRAAQQIAALVIDRLRAEIDSTTPRVYQVRMPNGAFLTIRDTYLNERRMLIAVGKNPAGLRATYGLLRQPRDVNPKAPWFSWPPRDKDRKTIATWAALAFTRQDDEAVYGAIELDPSGSATSAGE